MLLSLLQELKMSVEANKKLTHEIFEQTGLKVDADDPTIILAAAINTILGQNMEQYDDNLYRFTEQYIKRLNSQLDNTSSVLEDKIQAFATISDGIYQDFDNRLKKLPASIEEKNKELNFILTKIQASNDKAVEEQFSVFLREVQQQVQLLAKKQSQLSQHKYRELAIGGIAFAAGVIICLLIVFIVG